MADIKEFPPVDEDLIDERIFFDIIKDILIRLIFDIIKDILIRLKRSETETEMVMYSQALKNVSESLQIYMEELSE